MREHFLGKAKERERERNTEKEGSGGDKEREGTTAKEEALQPFVWVTRDNDHLKCSRATI